MARAYIEVYEGAHYILITPPGMKDSDYIDVNTIEASGPVQNDVVTFLVISLFLFACALFL